MVAAATCVILASACDREADATRPDVQDAATDFDAGPPPALWPDGRTIRIATWNVERFFDTVCDSGACGAGSFELAPSPSDFERRADEIAAAIEALDAHVVMLQEIENQTCLDALRARLPQYTAAVLAESGTPASVDVAVLARAELVTWENHGDTVFTRPDGTETSFTRELPEVHLDIDPDDGRPVDVIAFAAHYKSKRDDDAGRRLAEAEATRDLMLAAGGRQPEALIVLGGDLNDTPNSPPLQALTDGGALVRVADDVPDVWVITYPSFGSAIDHLVYAPDSGGEYVPTTARARTDTSEAWGGSDHAALTALFELPE